jgi:hypothetical protein
LSSCSTSPETINLSGFFDIDISNNCFMKTIGVFCIAGNSYFAISAGDIGFFDLLGTAQPQLFFII